MSTQLTEPQIEKMRALGRAARTLAEEYKEGKGPNPKSGATYQNGVPHCTWGQLLHKAGFNPGGEYSTGGNFQAFTQFLGTPGLNSKTKIDVVEHGMIEDKLISFDMSTINDLGTQIMNNNDPCKTAKARKQGTWKLLDQLADEIDKVFGAQQTEYVPFETAAEQYLEQLVLGEYYE